MFFSSFNFFIIMFVFFVHGHTSNAIRKMYVLCFEMFMYICMYLCAMYVQMYLSLT